ncbi:MAG TPA: TerB family tellurite resistance protein [Polyangiaceae bacterium]|nr:TerB family tellurite resistance protein [Polyangiaceae bacterium]
MTPGEKHVLRSLVAVAWTDGQLADGEVGVIEGLLSGFDATDEEEAEILAYAKTRRSLGDIPVGELSDEDKELLLSNAALITHADGDQSEDERGVLDQLVELLGFAEDEAEEIIAATRDGVLNLGTKPLD